MTITESYKQAKADMDIHQLIDLDAKRRRYLKVAEELRAEKNFVSNTIIKLQGHKL